MKSWPLAASPPTCVVTPSTRTSRTPTTTSVPCGESGASGLIASSRTVEPRMYVSSSWSRPPAISDGSRSRCIPKSAEMPAASRSPPVCGSLIPANGPSTRSTWSTFAMAADRSMIRWTLAGSVGEPSTLARTTMGDVSPARKSLERATEASRLSMPGGRIDASGMPWLRRRNGVPRMSRKASVGMRTANGRAITQCAIRSQREALAASAASPTGRPSIRRVRSRSAWTLSELTRGPSMPRTAGRNVRAKKTDAPTVSAPPIPNERKAVGWKSSSPDRPTATASPENVTALPLVATVIWTAVPTSRPRRSSSRNRLTMNNE